MARTSGWVGWYRALGAVLVVTAALATATLSSCGGGGGSSDADGGLCSQCGDSPDGPCLPKVSITPGQGVRCTDPTQEDQPSCTVLLRCNRKSDSSQRRCFPVAPPTPGQNPDDAPLDFQVRCDGSRPGGTPRPEPSGTPSETPSTAATPSNCGNGIVDSGEQCDGSNLNGLSCELLGCTTPLTGGGLSCFNTCTLNVSGCLGNCTIQ